MARIVIGTDPDKEPTNLSLSKKLKDAARTYCKNHRIPLSELVSGLLEDKIKQPTASATTEGGK